MIHHEFSLHELHEYFLMAGDFQKSISDIRELIFVVD